MKKYEKIQEKIDRTTIENKILMLLNQYQVNEDGIEWSTETIAKLLGIGKGGVGLGLMNLKKQGHVDLGGGQWFITSEGRSALKECCGSFQTRKSDLQFRNEVLTGCDGNGKQTKIKNAALPIGKGADRTVNRVEQDTVRSCTVVERIRAVADYYEVPPDVASNWCSTGEIHLCKRCGKYRRFHRKNGSNGQSWQTICIECRKKERV